MWVVTWIFINTFMVTCDINKPYEDPYRGLVYPTVMYAIACWDTEIEEKSARFRFYDEALKFVREGEGDSDLNNFKISFEGE